MNSKTLTSKTLNIALRQHLGVTSLMKEFGYAEEELFEAVEEISLSGSGEYIRKLKKKLKAERKYINKNASEILPNTISEENQNSTETFANEPKSVEEASSESSAEVVFTELEQLTALEENLSTEVRELEIQREKLLSKKKSVMAKLENAKKALLNLIKLVQFQEENVLRLCDEFESNKKSIAEVNDKKSMLIDDLNVVRAKIKSLKHVTILVYEDGSMDVENAVLPEILETEIAARIGGIFAYPEAGIVTGNAIKAIARLQIIVKTYQADNVDFEIIFDNDNIEKLWKAVSNV